MKAQDIEFLLCTGIASFTCPECNKNIKATTDEVLSEDPPFKCPHCGSIIEIDGDAF
ncbi:MAG: hypothetical protein ACOYU3_07010 [Bacillota bacterium]